MTNEEIVMRESVDLMKQGILACAGQFEAKDEDGNTIMVDVPEEIHTYQEWKLMGKQVKKGEHAIAKFAVWKPVKGKKKDESEQGETNIEIKKRFIMCNASWFKGSQVEEVSVDTKEV